MNGESTLNAALRHFELVEANLVKLETLWKKIEDAIPKGIAFGESTDFENWRRAFSHILEHIPPINGKKPESLPLGFDEIGQMRFDAAEIGEIECHVATEQRISAPGSELREYRYDFNRARRQLVQSAVEGTITKIESILRQFSESPVYKSEPGTKIENDGWTTLKDLFAELGMMLGSEAPQQSRWSDLQRHLRFGQSNDLRDIIEFDWPSVRAAIYANMYGEYDPLPVQVGDLADLIAAKPTGPIATKLAWESLKDEEFERLIFTLVSSTSGYENTEWLTRTNAPDKGRDISAYRVFTDVLGGTIRNRIIFQCKHWLSKSISVGDISVLREQMRLWEPPRVDVHVIATSGRFTTDAVDWIERNNQSDTALRIEMWPESSLERFLASRPDLIATFHLR